MILESITGLDSLSVGDVIINDGIGTNGGTNKDYRYRIDQIDLPNGRLSITNVRLKSDYGWYYISTFTRPYYKVQKQFMPYDPNQQGEDDDSI